MKSTSERAILCFCFLFLCGCAPSPSERALTLLLASSSDSADPAGERGALQIDEGFEEELLGMLDRMDVSIFGGDFEAIETSVDLSGTTRTIRVAIPEIPVGKDRSLLVEGRFGSGSVAFTAAARGIEILPGVETPVKVTPVWSNAAVVFTFSFGEGGEIPFDFGLLLLEAGEGEARYASGTEVLPLLFDEAAFEQGLRIVDLLPAPGIDATACLFAGTGVVGRAVGASFDLLPGEEAAVSLRFEPAEGDTCP